MCQKNVNENIKMKYDALSTRMKEQYENRTRYFLPRRTYTILRLDGCHFHTYTRGLNRPFDEGLMEDMKNAVIATVGQLQGVGFAYTQSDEISILLTDFEKNTTDAWFNGNIQKICSVAASILTSEFNRFRLIRELGIESGDKYKNKALATFDCRAFTIPDRVEVANYFRWRQQDCIRNSVSMVAQYHYSHKELHGKSQSDMHEMLHQKGVNWATNYFDSEKNGQFIFRQNFYRENNGEPITYSKWMGKGAWVFSKDEGKLLEMIPNYT